MPFSLEMGKDITKEWFSNQNDIQTIVDLGIGAGTYPKLLGKDKYIWKGVEIWAPYIERYKLKDLYQEIRIGDIQYMELPDGDCAIIGDVMEHLEKEAAIKTFFKVDKQFEHVVLSIPTTVLSNRNFKGNRFESHLSSWTWEELCELIPQTYKIRKRVKPVTLFIK